MSTADRVQPAASPILPPLIAGQRLDQPTFHARYSAMPPGIRAELIEGVVFMASPVGIPHGEAHADLAFWLGLYRGRTPGIQSLDNTSVVLGLHSEIQPDLLLRIKESHGGQSRSERRIVHGAPELVMEVSHSSRGLDLGPKLAEYAAARVLEYVVRTCEPDEVIWHVLQENTLVRVEPDGDGLHRSAVFPGLWLDVPALLTQDLLRVQAVVEQGTASAEHVAFVERLRARSDAAGA